MFDLLNIAKALSDANRLRILMALRTAPLCVCQITAFLDLAPSTTSKHLSILRQARLIDSIKQGRWVYYQLAATAPSEAVRTALEWVQSCLLNDTAIQQDSARIVKMLEATANSVLDEDAADDAPCISPTDIRNFCHSPELHMLDQAQYTETSTDSVKEHDHD